MISDKVLRIIESLNSTNLTISSNGTQSYISIHKFNGKWVVYSMIIVVDIPITRQFFSSSPRYGDGQSIVDDMITTINNVSPSKNIEIREKNFTIHLTSSIGGVGVKSWAKLKIHQLVSLLPYMTKSTIKRTDNAILYTTTVRYGGDKYICDISSGNYKSLRLRLSRYIPLAVRELQSIYHQITNEELTNVIHRRFKMNIYSEEQPRIVEIREFVANDCNIVVSVRFGESVEVIVKVLNPGIHFSDAKTITLDSDLGNGLDDLLKINLIGYPTDVVDCETVLATLISIMKDASDRL